MTGPLSDRVGFAIGTGRCGTHFIAKLLEHEPQVAAYHERDPLLENFHRWCKWNELPVDDAGFLQAMERRIRFDLATHPFSFESSTSLALSVIELERQFSPRFALLVRHPYDVVRSHLQKGWYAEPLVQQRPELALGYQETKAFHHYLGRIAPRGEGFARWNRYTRVGKLAWYWKALNSAALEKGESIPSGRWRVYRIEDFDYATYLEFASYVGYQPALTRGKFDEIRESRPGKQRSIASTPWSSQETEEFEAEVSGLAARLGYAAKHLRRVD